MHFDVFFSICQAEVDGVLPSEASMLASFFDQVRLADEVGFDTAWVAETHLSCAVQQGHATSVIPHFRGEIGLNTDTLQLGHLVFACTRRIHVGSAIRSILSGGGPIAHAEAVRTFLALHQAMPGPQRTLHLGFGAGRFAFALAPFGIVPRDDLETAAWPVVRHKIFLEATEIFLRLVRGDVLGSDDLAPQHLTADDFRDPQQWEKVVALRPNGGNLPLAPRWRFAPLAVLPRRLRLEHLRLTLGSHDPVAQATANRFLPCGVFNLSFTPPEAIETTHARMARAYHASGGPWQRAYMPRTVMIFIDHDTRSSLTTRRARARAKAEKALQVYWQAMEGTVDPARVASGVDNALVGTPEDVHAQIAARFHPHDRLMLWFDFFNHDNADVKASMLAFARLMNSPDAVPNATAP